MCIAGGAAIWYPTPLSTFLGVVEEKIKGFRGQMPTGLGYFLVRRLQFVYQATFPCVLYPSYVGDLAESNPRLDPIGPIGSNEGAGLKIEDPPRMCTQQKPYSKWGLL